MIYIVVPAYNEAKTLAAFLESMVNQTLLPNRLVLVDDNSTDETFAIATEFAEKFSWISVCQNKSEALHKPGSKVINAFNKGLESLPKDYEIILKLDADLILPANYVQEIDNQFKNHPKTGITGGFAYIFKNNEWTLENLTDKDHVRGALKAYRKKCFESIGGLKTAMGWDTLDELLAQFCGWEVQPIESLKVKHLKPTGANYSKKSAELQGLAFYQLGYGPFLTGIASLKLAFRKKKISLFFAYQLGFWTAFFQNEKKLVSPDQEKFIRNYRWKKIKEKIMK